MQLDLFSPDGVADTTVQLSCLLDSTVRRGTFGNQELEYTVADVLADDDGLKGALLFLHDVSALEIIEALLHGQND